MFVKKKCFHFIGRVIVNETEVNYGRCVLLRHVLILSSYGAIQVVERFQVVIVVLVTEVSK